MPGRDIIDNGDQLSFRFDSGNIVTYMTTERKLRGNDFFAGHPGFASWIFPFRGESG